MATIKNKQSITTTANQTDIFVLSQAGTRFINRGNLTTTGIQSSPIDITADNVIVQNFGDLTASGADSPTLLAGHRDDPVDGVAIYNFGSILNDAPFVDLNGNEVIDLEEYFPDAIQYHGTNGLIENRGTITVPTRNGAAIGLLASDTTVINIGEIHANIVGIIVDNFGGGRDRNTVINEGLIDVSGGTFGYGIRVLSNDNVVINKGDIVATGDFYVGIQLQGTGNHGENDGTITVSGNEARGVRLVGEDHTFINRGDIIATGPDSVGVGFSGILTNLGNISSEEGRSVSGTEGNETLINRGSLEGGVSLGGGNDLYIAGKGGSLDGILTLGAGDDLIVVEKSAGLLTIDDFNDFGGTDDVIDVSALGISSFEELLGHASESSGIVTLDFGKTQVVLNNVTLDSLTVDDFIFDGQAVGGFVGAGSFVDDTRTEDYSAYNLLMV